ncbi:MAG TPA: carboxypeptidase-like regulatory domain-containing protein [Cyclobacteriaceae bacterium]|nr:carboxypeptidase-like regulatory domain-containing protein [Cyclobacteriaceae bacterium]HMV10421.1 carboxypeptidase-like regulatory domain-containing protein [Cyclobacteriaceae bacterium]HMV90431.1 carboxypeptidase-like regulatory domain-containing protein [Cyclobacteriaceae bacterium]HMX01344.1 carboxypeptidase-like regulatory domain-containing protein [Cyclobacteriaceae bacterium]HMX50385.1 carboxypeptidase-like regulatory domain-containing protein [Cyclobacteriaceae bacterium]
MQRVRKESGRRSDAEWRIKPSSRLARCAFALLLLFATVGAIAQSKSISGSILDQNTKEPIPYVHVFANNRLVSMSDPSGNFMLRISSPNDSLTFSCIGYQTLTLPLSHFVREKSIVAMTEDRVILQTVTIRSLSAKDFIRKCIEKISDRYNRAGTWKAFYWRVTRFNELPTEFFESYLTGFENHVTYDSISEAVHNIEEQIPIYDSLVDALKFDVVNQSAMFVNPANLDDWKYEYFYSSGQNEKHVVIEATMIQNPFQPQVETNTLKIYIDSNDYGIVRIDFSYRWKDGKRYAWRDDVVFALSQLDGTVEYQKRECDYTLQYLTVETQFKFMRKYNPIVLSNARLVHELVTITGDMPSEKPVVRWNDYLEAKKLVRKP